MCAMILVQYLAHRSQYLVPKMILISLIPIFCLRNLRLSSYLTAERDPSLWDNLYQSTGFMGILLKLWPNRKDDLLEAPKHVRNAAGHSIWPFWLVVINS